MNDKISIEETIDEELNDDIFQAKEEMNVPLENQLKYSLVNLIDEAEWIKQFMPEFKDKLQGIQTLAKDVYYRNFGDVD